MLRKRVNAYTVGLVIKNGAYNRTITNGSFWVMPNEEVLELDMTKPFITPFNLNILLKDEKLASMLEVVDVKDNEIVLQYENGIFKTVLTAGRYAFWKGVTKYKFIVADISKPEITEAIDKLTLVRKEMINYIRVFAVESFEKGLMFVEGKFEKMLGPGAYYFWKNPVVVTVLKADMRLMSMEVSGQELLTKDKAAIRINFQAQYKVKDVEKALLENKEFEKQFYVLIQLSIRAFVGSLTLDELLDKKESVAPYIIEAVKEKAEELGVELSACGIKDVILPGDVKDIMNHVLVAEKKAQANTIMRREETASARSLLNTAKLMEDNEMLFKLKEMEYVEKIADKINSISLGGGTQIVEQLKQIFVPEKKK
jgi:regulator of protease activity HflC (stomatin/prohibitin superfamily)